MDSLAPRPLFLLLKHLVAFSLGAVVVVIVRFYPLFNCKSETEAVHLWNIKHFCTQVVNN